MKKIIDFIKKMWIGFEGPLTWMVLLSVCATLTLEFLADGWLIFSAEELGMLSAYVILLVYFLPKFFKENKKKTIEKNKLLKFGQKFLNGVSLSIIINIVLQYLFSVLLKVNATATTDGLERTFIFYIIVCIIGPIVEEICNRGMTKVRLEKWYSSKFVIISTALVFGLSHASSIGNILYALIMGAILMIMYIKTNNLLYPICFHIGCNVGACLLDFLPIPSMNNAGLYILIVLVSILLMIIVNLKCIIKKHQ